jgi:4-alpha-glucanotransferase
VIDASHLGELGRLATELGVQTGYWDTRGDAHVAEPDALVSVLRAMGAPVDAPDRLDDLRHHVEQVAVRPIEPVVVHWQDQPCVLELRIPEGAWPTYASYHVVLDGGGALEGPLPLDEAEVKGVRHADGRAHLVVPVVLPLPGRIPRGYHRLVVELDDVRLESTLIEAPERVVQPGPHERTWGVLAALHSLRPQDALGPHVGELAEVGRWIDGHGGRIVATLPILATYLGEPFDPSPYTPVSQRFWNELYCDLSAVPELADCPEAVRLLEDGRTAAAVAGLGRGELFDHRAQYRLVRPVLEALARTFWEAPASARAGFQDWVAQRPDVLQYASFRAATDATGTGWHAWGATPGSLPHGFDPAGGSAATHLYAQWTMHQQLHAVADELAERDQRLYLDLPVGTHGDGFDTWAHHDLFAWGCGVGAPPDDFFGAGQNWGFPPINPLAAREQGHRHFAACLRHHMGAARILRLDHVMGLHRLYWVPDGADARDGVYVRYPSDELFAVLAVESAHGDVRVVGEDLGTVPDEIRHAVDRHGLLGMYVSQFRLPGEDGHLPEPTDRQVASIDTHDTPTFAGWARGLDADVNLALGFVDEAEAARTRTHRAHDVEQLRAALDRQGLQVDPGDEPALFAALVTALGASPAPALLVGIDDLVGETDPQNVPGTGLDRPNWVRRLPCTVAELTADPKVLEVLDAVQRARLGAHEAAKEEEER